MAVPRDGTGCLQLTQKFKSTAMPRGPLAASQSHGPVKVRYRDSARLRGQGAYSMSVSNRFHLFVASTTIATAYWLSTHITITTVSLTRLTPFAKLATAYLGSAAFYNLLATALRWLFDHPWLQPCRSYQGSLSQLSCVRPTAFRSALRWSPLFSIFDRFSKRRGGSPSQRHQRTLELHPGHLLPCLPERNASSASARVGHGLIFLLVGSGRSGKWSGFLRVIHMPRATADRYVQRRKQSLESAKGNCLTESIPAPSADEITKMATKLKPRLQRVLMLLSKRGQEYKNSKLWVYAA